MIICSTICNCQPADETISDPIQCNPTTKILCGVGSAHPSGHIPCLYFLQEHSEVCEENDQDVTIASSLNLGLLRSTRTKLEKTHRSLGGSASGEDRCAAFQEAGILFWTHQLRVAAASRFFLSFLRARNITRPIPLSSRRLSLGLAPPFKHYYCAPGVIMKLTDTLCCGEGQ